MTEAELFATAEDAAGRLVAALHAGEATTGSWQDEHVAQSVVNAALNGCLQTLAATEVWGPANRLASGKLWEIAGEWLRRGEMQYRARIKPRGYAGDDILLARMCDHWKCEDPLGRLFDDYFQRHAAPTAVRNRTQVVAEAIVAAVDASAAPVLRVVSVGSGPALDMHRAAEQLTKSQRQRLQLVLLDLDPLALETARGRLEPLLAAEQIITHRENLYRLASRPLSCDISHAQLVACTGFFDYLADEDAANLLRFLWSQVAPQGRLLVFNFAPHNPSRALMEWVANWYLIYRDRPQMLELAHAAGLPPANVEIQAEAVGIDLYIDAVQT
jgi:SAM-dependent methyltransferase